MRNMPERRVDRAQQARWSADERRALTRRSTVRGVAVFLGNAGLYAGATAAALAPLPWALNLVLAICAGVFIGTLFTVGHDASHQSLTPYRTLNIWLARLAFLPALHSASLWDLSHNRIHHRFTNLRGWDYVWEPMSPEDYRTASRARRILYRLYRSPLGPLPYYAIEMWWKRHFLPISAEARRQGRRHAFDTVFLFTAYPLLVGAIVASGAALAPDRPLWLTAVWGWIVPYAVWNWLMGFVIYAHHTHPAVAWIAGRDAWTSYRGHVLGTVHARLPPPLHAVANNIMEHTAHHVMPGIPLYRLRDAQARLRERVPEVVFSPLMRDYLRTVAACKLFDYEKRQWQDFDGRPTGPVIPRDGGAVIEPALTTTAAPTP